MRNSPRAFLIFALIIAGVCLCIAHGAVVAAENATGFEFISLFLAIGIQSARLTCDGEVLEVVAHSTTWGDVEICAVACDSIAPWRSGVSVSMPGCEAQLRGEAR